MLANSVLLTILVILIIVLMVIFLKLNRRTQKKLEVLREQEKVFLRQSEEVRKEQEQLERYKKEIRETIEAWKQQSGESVLLQRDAASFQESQEMLLKDMQAERSANIYWENPVLNMIFMHKLEECEESHIAVTLEGFPMNGIALPDKSTSEMIGLFANLMDNAVEACRHLPEDARWIRLQVTSEQKKMIFVLENSCGEISQRAHGEKTWKANKEEHGIGKDIIHELVSRNQGWITFAQKDGVHRVELMLPTEG